MVANSAALLEVIFEENGLQNGGQNRLKINKKVIQNLIIFDKICNNDIVIIQDNFDNKSLAGVG